MFVVKVVEDVWITPFAPEWRKIYMQRVRQIAATGINGIYVDIPYWMTHFTGCENSWASFDDYTVNAFHDRTGLNARTDIKLGDFNDPGFRKWIDFRIQTITGFLAEIRRNATSVNPNIAVIPEIYPGIEESAVRVGADVYRLYPVVDAVSHEYEFGDGEDHTAASRGQYDWFMYQIGMQSFRAFAGNKPTWMLNYSWNGNPRVAPSDAMKNLAMSELMAGANFWDAPGHTMAGSNDMATRTQIFHWIASHQSTFSSPRTPVGKVGVYFSDRTRNYFPDEFLRSYRGALLLLLRSHIQFQIVTPRTLASFHGSTLVLPDVRVLSSEELARLQNLSRSCKIVSAGKVDDRLNTLHNLIHLQDDPGSTYLALARLRPLKRGSCGPSIAPPIFPSRHPRILPSTLRRSSIGRIGTLQISKDCRKTPPPCPCLSGTLFSRPPCAAERTCIFCRFLAQRPLCTGRFRAIA